LQALKPARGLILAFRWALPRDASPDGLLVVRRSRCQSLLVVGLLHFRGWSARSPTTSDLMAETVISTHSLGKRYRI